jgi:hypothetical protein
MPDEVILDVTTIEENVTVETTAGDVVGIKVVAPTGPAGATGPAGPNSVTSATTSDGTANLSIAGLEVVGGEIYTDGDYSQIYTQGTDAHIFTLGSGAEIFTVGEVATIATQGENATISTAGAGATIGTQGANATIYTQGANATISTAGSAAHIQTSHASAAVKSTNFAAVESGGASLVDGSMQPCLTWSAGGRNLTIPSGTATTFNTTSYTYGTGAAAAHRDSLGLTTLATTTPAINVATFLATPSSANLAAAVTGETGSGALVFGTSPTLTTPTIAQINGNTTASGTLTLQSTTNDTKGKILFGTSAYDETTNALGIGNTSPSYKLEIGNASAAFDALNSSTGLGVLSSSTRNSFFIESTAASSSSAGAFIGAYSNDGSAMASGDRLGGFFFGGYDGSVMRNAAIIHAFSEEAWSGGANGTGVTIGTTAAGTTSRSDKFFFRSSGSLLIGTPTENTKSILTLESTTRGFLPPRMTTTQRNAITSVPAGLMVYNTTTNKLNFYNGSAWEAVTSL